MFTKSDYSNGTIVSTLTISATVENSNTQLSCHATGDGGAVTSETVTLTVAGKSHACIAKHRIIKVCTIILRSTPHTSLARHTPQSEGKRGLVTARTASCTSDKILSRPIRFEI